MVLDSAKQCYMKPNCRWAVLTETQDWVFGAELAVCDRRLFTLGGVASRQVQGGYCPQLS